MSLTQYPSFRSWRIAVPITTALFGALGGGTGLYAILSPGPEPLKLFGLPPMTNLDSGSADDNRQRALLQVYAIRNVATALGNLGLLAFWRFSATCQSSPVAAGAVQKAFAILFLTGTVVGITDGLIVHGYAGTRGLSPSAKQAASEKGQGHITMMIPVVALAMGWWYL